jgi:hypothetical protein
MWSIYTFGLMCILAVLVSCCVKVDRNAVVTAALVIGTNWLLFAMAWIHPEVSPAFIMTDLGIYMTHEETWSVMDLASLMVVGIVCRRLWWAPILWSAYLVTLAMHAVAWANGLEYLDYRRVLDAALILQLATLFVVGGGDAADRLFDFWSSVRGVRRDPRRVVENAS